MPGNVNKEATKDKMLDNYNIKDNNSAIKDKLFTHASREFNTEDKVIFVKELVEAVFSATAADREKYLCKLFFEKEEDNRLDETKNFAENINDLIFIFIFFKHVLSFPTNH